MDTFSRRESESISINEIRTHRPSFYDDAIDVATTQDSRQRASVSVAFLFELYRVLMGTMLLLFVPQKCGDDACGLATIVYSSDSAVSANFAVNLATLVVFVSMYGVEVYRENKMIEYLEVNAEHPTDNEAVGEILIKLPEDHTRELWRLDGYYQKAGYVAMLLFLVNTAFSGYNVYNRYLDDSTATAFATNVLFLAGKLGQVYTIVRTDKNVFYSAYLTKKMQYNYVDPDKMIEDTIHPVPSAPESSQMVRDNIV